MRLLLDTNIYVYMLSDRKSLSKDVCTIVTRVIPCHFDTNHTVAQTSSAAHDHCINLIRRDDYFTMNFLPLFI